MAVENFKADHSWSTGGRNGKGSTTSNKSSGNKNSGSSSNSSTSFDKNKDYAAAIKAATSQAEKNRLIAERQNKINWMNSTGNNKNGYTNDIYKNNTGTSSFGGSSSKGGTSYGGFDPNKDYAAAINSAKSQIERDRLIAERELKIAWQNATGQNKGYTNDIYKKPTSSFGGTSSFTPPKIVDTPKGRYTDSFQDFSIGIDAKDPQQKEAAQNRINSAIAAMQQNIEAYGTATPEMQDIFMRENQDYADQLRRMGVEPYQTGGRLYYNRLPSGEQKEPEGAYTGDHAMSLPDIALLRQYQTAYNDAKARGDETGMNAAHEMAEKLRANYREYPLKDSNGYGLGENDIGFIRDMTVRTDALGGRFVDEYNRNSVTTRKYDKDGNLQYTHTGSIPRHDARAAKDFSETNRRLALQGKDNNTFYSRVADPNDLSLSNGDFRTKYALAGSIDLGGGPTNALEALFSSADIYNASQLKPEYAGNAFEGIDPGNYNGMTKQEIWDAYNGIAKNQADQRNSMLSQLLAQYDAQKAQGEESFDDIARQAYIAKRQGETALPQRLAALGISGGGSESADLQLQANYQNNLNSNEQARQKMLKDYALQALIAQAQADSDISGYYSTANQNAMSAWQSELQNQNSWNQWAANFELQQQQMAESMRQWELNYALQKQQQADSLTDKEYEREWQERKYQDSLNQYALEMALKTGDFSKLAESGYNTDYLKQMQQAELEKMALEAAKLRSQMNKSGSGGGNRSSNGGNSGNDEQTAFSSGGQVTNGFTHLMMNYRLLGDTSAFENRAVELLSSGAVTPADYNNFMNNYKKVTPGSAKVAAWV